MELYDVMRTTFAARDFTDDPLPDEVLLRILDNARFAPSGGNRQGTHITVVRDADTRRELAELGRAAARRYFAQLQAGENPWNSVHPSGVPQDVIDRTEIPETFVAPIAKAPAVLVFSVDLAVVAAIDQDLGRVGLAGGRRSIRSSGTCCWPPAARATAAPSPLWPLRPRTGSAGCWASPTCTRSPRSCHSANRCVS